MNQIYTKFKYTNHTPVVLRDGNDYPGYAEIAAALVEDVTTLSERGSVECATEAQDLKFGVQSAINSGDHEQVGISLIEAEDLLKDMGYVIAWASDGGYRIYKA